MDRVSAIMLKSTAPAIFASLTKVFNMSIATGCFPKDYQFSKALIPPYQKNYWPISILPIISKLLEGMFILLCLDTDLKTIQFHHLSGASCPGDLPPQLYARWPIIGSDNWMTITRSAQFFRCSESIWQCPTQPPDKQPLHSPSLSSNPPLDP